MRRCLSLRQGQMIFWVHNWIHPCCQGLLGGVLCSLGAECSLNLLATAADLVEASERVGGSWTFRPSGPGRRALTNKRTIEHVDTFLSTQFLGVWRLSVWRSSLCVGCESCSRLSTVVWFCNSWEIWKCSISEPPIHLEVGTHAYPKKHRLVNNSHLLNV